MSEKILNELLTMSQNLGDPTKDYAILGEGNTSARIDEDTFYIKASGTALATLGLNDVVQVAFKRVMDLRSRLNGTTADYYRARIIKVEREAMKAKEIVQKNLELALEQERVAQELYENLKAEQGKSKKKKKKKD